MDLLDVQQNWEIESWLNNIHERELLDFSSFFSATNENEVSEVCLIFIVCTLILILKQPLQFQSHLN